MSTEKAKSKTAVNPDNYGYATGRIRALEATLMTQSDFSRLFEARQIDDIARLMQEKGYDSGDVEESLRLKTIQTYEIMREIIPDKSFWETLLLFNDCHNLKVMLKYLSTWWTKADDSSENVQENLPESDAGLAYHGLESALRKPSLIEPARLFRAVRDRRPDLVEPWIYDLAVAGSNCYLRTYDTGSMDMLIDKASWQLAAERADKLDNAYFSGYLIMKQDLLNLEILLRCRSLRSGSEYLNKALLENSSISVSEWLAAYDSEPDEILDLFMRSTAGAGFDKRTAAGLITDYGQPKTAAALGKYSDLVLLDWINQAAKVLRGPEVPLAYLLKRELEIRNVRIAITCLRNNIPSAQARELARAAV